MKKSHFYVKITDKSETNVFNSEKIVFIDNAVMYKWEQVTGLSPGEQYCIVISVKENSNIKKSGDFTMSIA